MTAVNIWKPDIILVICNFWETSPNYHQLQGYHYTTLKNDYIDPCESISDHMYRMGLTTMLITDKNVDRNKCIRIALVH
ncbi:BTE_HP_G0153040.mRNA.1.CDS.1 [Saccharomyces cerevisiae]|nr:BTE_HP_G0153040.mRNA.1.CDS.1 [Saccharomyces cerevisiae]CAI7010045.1 BTE_HP_G0153040.mRNA.1.CDS.1 [Saccharomyces cerevisiae]